MAGSFRGSSTSNFTGSAAAVAWRSLLYAMMSVGDDITRARWRACRLAVESSNTGWGMGEAAVHCRSATTANLLRHFSIGGIRPAAPTPGNSRKSSRGDNGTGGSCTCSLRIIAPPRKPGNAPYHPMVRGRCHDSTPLLLSARGVGTSVVMCHAALRLAQPRRRGTAETGYPHHTTASTLQRASTVCRADPETPLCPV